MLQTVGGTGGLQVGASSGQQLQQIQVVPVSGLQVGADYNFFKPLD